MKNTKFLKPLVAMIAVISFMACDNESLEGQFSNNPPVNNSEVEEKFQVDLDSILYVGQTVHATMENGELLLKAYQGKGRMELRIFAADTGTFKLESQEATIKYVPDGSVDTLLYISKSGSIKITAIDSARVSGSFSGKLEEALGKNDSIPMTNGIFENIALTSFDNDTSLDSATANIDGVEFTAGFFPYVLANNQINLVFINETNDQIKLVLPQDLIAGTNSITSFPSDFSAVYTDFTQEGEVKYYSVFDSGEISITSYENGIISGTFFFDAKTTSGDENVSITEGTFTINID